MSQSKMIMRVLLVVAICGARSASATPVPITFEGLADGTSIAGTYGGNGLTFTNATVLTAGISLNEVEFPPHSGLNVVTDDGGPITISFASPVDAFAGYFTYTEALSLAAFDTANLQVASAVSLFSQNFTSSGKPTNELIQIAYAGGFSFLRITGDPAGSSFVLDDLTQHPGGTTVPPVPTVAPEPGGLVLLGTGCLVLIGLRRSMLLGSR